MITMKEIIKEYRVPLITSIIVLGLMSYNYVRMDNKLAAQANQTQNPYTAKQLKLKSYLDSVWKVEKDSLRISK